MPNTTVLGGAIHAHDISWIESSRAARAFLTGLHFGGLSSRDHDPLHGVRANRTVNKRLGLEMGYRLLRLRASLNVHVFPSSLHMTQVMGQKIEKFMRGRELN